ncbi:MAG: hypothetical protein J5725_13285 [Bacteroidales bacterium]|nr:hypothetical protein [Bacteroidales bacterium]
MKIIVLSCSKNKELFYPFWYLMQKYYPNHPEIIYFTDGTINPFYKTIPINYDLEHWTTGLREFLAQIDDEKILLMIDDCFIRCRVNEKRINEAAEYIGGNIALMNFEKSWDENDEETELKGWKKRKHGSEFEVSLMCGIWQKDKLLKIIERDCNPWEIELNQMSYGYDFYINAGDYIIDWGYRTFQPCNIMKGKWTKECKEFLDSEGIKVNYNKKGFMD